MNLKRLLELVDLALGDPPENVKLYCGAYYSPYYFLMYLIASDFVADSYATSNGSQPLCVELGVEGGRGANAMVQAGALVMGVDNNPDRRFVLVDNENFIMTIGSSLPVPDRIKAKGKNISLLHVDTEHSFAQAREEFNAYKPQLIDGAVVLFDDTNAMEGDVWKFVESLPYEKFRDDRLHPSSGYAGIIYREVI